MLRKNLAPYQAFHEIHITVGNMKRKIDFVAGAGYTVKNIEKTDYINCSPPLLFSERFVEKIGNELSNEVEFFPCNLICRGISLNWYAARREKIEGEVENEFTY